MIRKTDVAGGSTGDTLDLASLEKDMGLAVADGYDAFVEKRKELLGKGVDSKTANVEALKAKHAVEAKRYEELVARFTLANDLKSATIFAKEVEKSKVLLDSLRHEAASAEQALANYSEAFQSQYEKGLASVPGAGSFVAKHVGNVFNAYDLAQALQSENPSEVTKAVSGIALGEIATFTGEALAVAVGLPAIGTGTLVAAMSFGAAYFLDKGVSDEDWADLTAVLKRSLSDMHHALDKGLPASIRDILHVLSSAFGGDLQDLAFAANDKFLAALNMIRRIDPLVLDLDGDGVETLGLDSGVMFDFDGDGVQTATGWIKGDDGFLVMDIDGTGSIDTGRELFGVDTVKRDGTKARNGFDALADLDSNADGVFDAQDEMYSRVKVWQDVNHDGVAQVDELKTLAEHHIAAILLKSKEANEDSNGNLISATGSFIRDDGTEGEVNGNQSVAADVDLESNPFYSEHTDGIEISDEVAALPTLMGSGVVRELREAAMLSEELRGLLASYISATTPRERKDV
jgi:hypothetical protein